MPEHGRALKLKVALVVAGVILAGCSSGPVSTPIIAVVTPRSAPTAPAPTATPTAAAVASAATATPTPSPRATPTLPAVASAVVLPVVRCPGTYATLGSPAAPPATWTARLPPTLASAYTYYGFDRMLILGPRGWKCEAQVAGDRGYWLSLDDPGDPGASVGIGGSPGTMPAMLDGGCPYWPELAKKALTYPAPPGPFSCTPPDGQRWLFVDTTDVQFVNPPGVASDGTATYADQGMTHYEPAHGISSVDCCVPAADAAICSPILDAFLAHPYD